MKLHKVSALAAVSMLAFAACSSGGSASSGTSAAPSGSAAAGASAAAGGTTGDPASAASCKDKKGKSSTEIHVYSSLPLGGTNTPETTAMVDQIKATIDGQKVGNFTIKYTSLDDSSAAKGGDWDGTVETSNANTAANDPDAMVYIGTFNSGAAKLSIPILNAACLVMLSPANSYPGLTHAVEGVTAQGEPDSYYPGGYRNYAASSTRTTTRPAHRPNGRCRSASRRHTSSMTARPTARASAEGGPSTSARSAAPS